MSQLSYYDQIIQQLRKAEKGVDAEKVLYYRQALACKACVSFENYKGSWAYDKWAGCYRFELNKIREELKNANGHRPY